MTWTTGRGRLAAVWVGCVVVAGCASARGGRPAATSGPPAASDSARPAVQQARARRCAEDSVMVGYGAQGRCALTSSVGTLAFDRRVTRVPGTLAEVLRARVAGLDVITGPNGLLSLRVRGAGRVNGGGEPLLVLDGMPIEGSVGGALASIEPRDVARVDVLKDAGSAAVYGARAANGVVIITTRRR